MLDALAHDERLAVEVDPGGVLWIRDDELAEPRHHRACRHAEAVRAHRYVAPRDEAKAFIVEDVLDRRLGLLGGQRLHRQESQPDGVLPRWWQDVAELGAQEAIGDLDEDPRSVAGVGLGAGGATVVEVGQRREGGVDELAAGHALQVGDEGDTTRVVLEAGVVQAVALSAAAGASAAFRLSSSSTKVGVRLGWCSGRLWPER